jgi:hypothetical protein
MLSNFRVSDTRERMFAITPNEFAVPCTNALSFQSEMNVDVVKLYPCLPCQVPCAHIAASASFPHIRAFKPSAERFFN